MENYADILESYETWIKNAAGAPVQLKKYPGTTVKSVAHGFRDGECRLEIQRHGSPIGEIYKSGTVAFLGLLDIGQEANDIRKSLNIPAPIKIEVGTNQEAYAIKIIVEGERRYMSPAAMNGLGVPADCNLTHEEFYSLIELPLSLSPNESSNLWGGALYLVDQNGSEEKINPQRDKAHTRPASPGF